MMRLLLSLTAVLALTPGTASAAEYDRECATHAEGKRPEDVAVPDARRDVVAGRVAIIGARTHVGRERPRGNRPWAFKTPVIIRAGAPVVVRVAARDRRYVALDFDPERSGGRDRTAADGQSSVRFHPCPPDTPRFTDGLPLGEWTGYPGGLLVDRPRCVTFEFLEAGKPTIRRRAGLGRACRG